MYRSLFFLKHEKRENMVSNMSYFTVNCFFHKTRDFYVNSREFESVKRVV